MPTEINQTDDCDARLTRFAVSGEMSARDAELVTRLAREHRDTTGFEVVIDLADIDLIDSEAAHILRNLASEDGFSLGGVETMLQTAVDHAEGRA